MKICTKCGETKALDGFGKDAQKRDGHMSRCRGCVKAYSAANAEHRAAYQRDHRAANRDVIAAYKRTYYVANVEKVAAYRAANSEKLAASSRAYHQAHPEVRWANGYRRRAKKYGIDPVVEDFVYADVITIYGDACVHCSGPFEHLDHYPVPVALGGRHVLDNVRPACAECNRGQSGTVRVARNINRHTEQVLDLVIQGLTEQGSPVG